MDGEVVVDHCHNDIFCCHRSATAEFDPSRRQNQCFCHNKSHKCRPFRRPCRACLCVSVSIPLFNPVRNMLIPVLFNNSHYIFPRGILSRPVQSPRSSKARAQSGRRPPNTVVYFLVLTTRHLLQKPTPRTNGSIRREHTTYKPPPPLPYSLHMARCDWFRVGADGRDLFFVAEATV